MAGGAAEAGAGGEGADGELRTEGVAAAVQVAGALDRQGKAWGWKELNGRRCVFLFVSFPLSSLLLRQDERLLPVLSPIPLRRLCRPGSASYPCRSMYWGGTLLPKSGSLIPAPFPSFMDGQWPDVLTRIAETGVYDEWTGGEGSSLGGPNHVRRFPFLFPPFHFTSPRFELELESPAASLPTSPEDPALISHSPAVPSERVRLASPYPPQPSPVPLRRYSRREASIAVIDILPYRAGR